MDKPQTLRFRARAHKLVTDYRAQAAGLRRFLGRRLDSTLGPEFLCPESKTTKRHATFVPLEDHEEVPWHDEHAHLYAIEVRAGNLWAADEETAAFCGVEFDPDFGGELAEEKRERAALAAMRAPAPVSPKHEEV